MTNTVKIGHSGVSASPLGLGTNKVGAHNLFKGLKDEDGAAVVKAALDQGITMLDTAYMYGLGHSEEVIGEVIKDYDRSQIVIATKAAQDPTKDYAANNSPAFLTQAVESALKRLQTDYIDVFYIHFPDDQTPKNEAVAALKKLKDAGKIRAIGVSNFNLAQLKEANQTGDIDIVEDNYNLVHRDAEQTLFPYLQEHGITFVPYFPLASGLLTGKYTADQQFPAGDWREARPNFQGARYQAIIKGVATVQQIAKAHNATSSQVILAWNLQNPAIGIVIPGARLPEQVKQNAGALQVHLSDTEYDQVEQAFTNLPA